MEIARDAIELGRAGRAHAKMKMRQPLAEAVVVAATREREAIERFEDLARAELNVKQIRYVDDADELGRWELKPNYRALGPRFGKNMPQVAQAVAALDASSAAERLRAGESVGITIDGKNHPLGADDVQMALQPLEGYQLERAGTHAVALNLELDESLVREGLAREVVHAVQNARKNAGLNVEDRISLHLAGDRELLDAVKEHVEYVTGEVLANYLGLDGEVEGLGDPQSAEIEGRTLEIALAKTEAVA
jgi:isoleucyl-tRNA synthetase